MNVRIANNYSLGGLIDDFIAELVAVHWLMSQGSDWGSMELSKLKYWIIMMVVAVQK